MHVNRTKFERNSSVEYYHMTFIGEKTMQAKVASSSETRGQIVGERERLNRAEKMARRKVKNGKSSSRRSLLFFAPFFSARLVFPLPPLSAPGSPRMRLRANGCCVRVGSGVQTDATTPKYVRTCSAS